MPFVRPQISDSALLGKSGTAATAVALVNEALFRDKVFVFAADPEPTFALRGNWPAKWSEAVSRLFAAKALPDSKEAHKVQGSVSGQAERLILAEMEREGLAKEDFAEETAATSSNWRLTPKAVEQSQQLFTLRSPCSVLAHRNLPEKLEWTRFEIAQHLKSKGWASVSIRKIPPRLRSDVEDVGEGHILSEFGPPHKMWVYKAGVPSHAYLSAMLAVELRRDMLLACGIQALPHTQTEQFFKIFAEAAWEKRPLDDFLRMQDDQQPARPANANVLPDPEACSDADGNSENLDPEIAEFENSLEAELEKLLAEEEAEHPDAPAAEASADERAEVSGEVAGGSRDARDSAGEDVGPDERALRKEFVLCCSHRGAAQFILTRQFFCKWLCFLVGLCCRSPPFLFLLKCHPLRITLRRIHHWCNMATSYDSKSAHQSFNALESTLPSEEAVNRQRPADDEVPEPARKRPAKGKPSKAGAKAKVAPAAKASWKAAAAIVAVRAAATAVPRVPQAIQNEAAPGPAKRARPFHFGA